MAGRGGRGSRKVRSPAGALPAGARPPRRGSSRLHARLGSLAASSSPPRLYMSETFQNYINGQWVDARVRRDVREPQPGPPVRPHRHVPAVRRGRRRRGRRGGQGGLQDVAARARAQARRDPQARRRPADRAQGRAGARDDARDGQALLRDQGRRAGGHRHGLLRDDDGPPALRPHGPVRDERQVQHDRPPPDRRVRPHHGVELPGRRADVEDVSGHPERQHGRVQAVRGRPALGHAARAGDARRGRAARRRQPRPGRRRDGRGHRRRTPTSRRSRSRARPRPAPASRPRPRRGTRASRSRWAARTRSS